MSTVSNKTIVAVRINPCNRIFFYESEEPLSTGDYVVVETAFGLRVGTVITKIPEEERPDYKDIASIVRKATEEDLKKEEENRKLEEEAFAFCRERIAARGIPMKLIRTEVMLDRRRIVFYFTADGRIDFRELVRDLAAKFRTRIEMRQIGVRDEAKILGGIGICGKEICCAQFLQNFAPISLKMAKEQELVLNTSKLTGLCGRLMCCLSYEYEGTIEGEDEVPIETEEGTICEECYESVLSDPEQQTAEREIKSPEDKDQDTKPEITRPAIPEKEKEERNFEPLKTETLPHSEKQSFKHEGIERDKIHPHKRDKHQKQKARRKRHKRKKKKRR